VGGETETAPQVEQACVLVATPQQSCVNSKSLLNLCPACVSVQVPEHIARPDYAGTGYPASEVDSRQQRSAAIRSPEEIAGIREACR
jgi:hypothetical protein